MDAQAIYSALYPLSTGLWERDYAEETTMSILSAGDLLRWRASGTSPKAAGKVLPAVISNRLHTKFCEQGSEVVSGAPTQKGLMEVKADLTEKLHARSGGGSFS